MELRQQNAAKEVIPTAKTQSALTQALTTARMLNNAVLPDHPESYISQYQLDIIRESLGIKEIQNVSIDISKYNKYSAQIEFPIAMEAARAGLHVYSCLKVEV